MNLITTILVEAVARLTEPAVKDAYNAVKSFIKQKFGGNSKVNGALDGLEEEPETWSKPLDSALTNAGAPQDDELKQLITTLEATLRAGTPVGKSGIQNTHSGTGDIVMGDKAGRDINKNTNNVNTDGGDYIGGNVTKQNPK